MLSGCSFFSFLGPARSAGTQVPIELARCSGDPAALCLESFGLSQNQLLITFYFPAAGSSQFHLKVWQGEAATIYPCTTSDAAPSTFYCTGPLIDLGTPIKIGLFTATGRTALAEGSLTLTDLALPTLGVASEGGVASLSVTSGPRFAVTTTGPAATPGFGSPATPATTTPTSTPGTAYYNPQPGSAYGNPTP